MRAGIALCLLVALPAAADEARLTLALYAPSAPFASGEARFSLVNRLAQSLQSATGMKVEGKAFARAGDFEAAVKKGQIDLALVDGVYLAERAVAFAPLATATSGGDTQSRWALFSSETGGVLELQGKRLAYAATGPRDLAFIDNALLDGELPKLFAGRQAAPDLAAAIAVVSLRKAQAVFAPEGMGQGLRKVFDAGRVPNPALVVVRADLPADQLGKVRQAALALPSAEPFDGWKAAPLDAYRGLAARLAPRARRPVMAEPEVVLLDDADLLRSPPLPPLLPDLRDQYWVPTGTP